MRLEVKKSELNGSVRIPGSKSHTIRAVAAAGLAEGQSLIREPLYSSDSLSAVAVYVALGAEVDMSDERCWKVLGRGGDICVPCGVIDVGNSGTTLRLAMGSASLSSVGSEIEFTGDKQIQSRPVDELLKALESLGGRAISVKNNGRAPVRIGGRLRGGRAEVRCVTSQYLSSLLMACPLADGDTELFIPLLNEPDYVRITLDWLDFLGVEYRCDARMSSFEIPGGQRYRSFEKTIAADFSSATFFLCAGAIAGGEVRVEGLEFCDSQPDKAVFDYLGEMGADIKCENGSVVVRGGRLKGAEIDMNRTPDALPAMAVTAAFAEGRTRLYNVAQARVKETDRIRCMAEELGRMNVSVEEFEDGLVIEGGAVSQGVILTAGMITGL
jgi:3-phosphoshikimate 1-carboxyvinyltransferase